MIVKMKNPPKPSLIEERNFPFETSISYGVEEGFHELHWHNEIEICYIKHGTGNYLINGIDYSFTEGDIFVINNDDIHLCYNDKELIMQVTMFDPFFIGSGSANPFDVEYLQMFINNSYGLLKKIEHKFEKSEIFSDILMEIETEYNKMQKGYEMMIKSLLLKFFVLLVRYSPDDSYPQKSISRVAADKIRHILQFIDNNYHEQINLNLLEQNFGMSRAYLSSSFKSLTGISPMDYIIQKRISEAKLKLIKTHKSILAISEECGFNSLSNFNRLFKKFAGYTPSRYRKYNLK